MKKDPKQIAQMIISLVSELADIAGADVSEKIVHVHMAKKRLKQNKGATGGLRVLIDENYFDKPKQFPEIIEKLKQEGRHYPKPTISMGLLNLVREKILIRLREKGTKNYQYVIRK